MGFLQTRESALFREGGSNCIGGAQRGVGLIEEKEG